MKRSTASILTVMCAISVAFFGTPATGASDWQPDVTPIGDEAPASPQHASKFDLTNVPPTELLSVVADTIRTLGAYRGFAGLTVDEPTTTITLHWRGDLPPDIRKYVGDASQHGVRVDSSDTAALFTREHLMAAAERLISDNATVEGFDLSWASVLPDGSGITVASSKAVLTNSDKTQVARTAGLPANAVTYELESGGVVFLSRQNDASPWKGGSRLKFPYNGLCTSGFPALASGSGRLLSAAHCDPNDNVGVTDGAGTWIAGAAGVVHHDSIDSLSIDPTSSPATTAKIHIGAWNGSVTTTVKNWAGNNIGDSVCQSGATLGTRCGTITDDSVKVSGLSGGWYVRARAASGYAAAGDSGGPIYRTITGGVQARGILVGGAGGTEVSCPANHDPALGGLPCYRDIVYTPISVTLNTWNFSLEVG